MVQLSVKDFSQHRLLFGSTLDQRKLDPDWGSEKEREKPDSVI